MMVNQMQAQYVGGALSLSGTLGRVILSNDTFTNNEGPQGGCISVTGAIDQMTLEDCKLNGNTGQVGGALYVSPTRSLSLLINHSEVRDNTVSVNGGGIFFQSVGGAIEMNNVAMSNNQAGSSGGGIQIINSDAKMIASSLTNNKAVTQGGGEHVHFHKIIN
jgi:hypothetical protein